MVRIRITSRERELLEKSFQKKSLIFDIPIIDLEILIDNKIIENLEKIIDCISDYFVSEGLQKNDEPNQLGLELEDLNTKFICELQRKNDEMNPKTKKSFFGKKQKGK